MKRTLAIYEILYGDSKKILNFNRLVDLESSALV